MILLNIINNINIIGYTFIIYFSNDIIIYTNELIVLDN